MEEGNHKPLKKKKMKKIPILKVGDDMLKFDCSICYMEFKKGNRIVKIIYCRGILYET